MAVTPDTIIHLLKVPIEIDEENQLTFANATAQYNYFISLPKKTEDDLQYQRKDNFIAWPDHIDNILQYNYVMYQNTNYSNKWFYAFITNMEYENDGMTKIYIEQDAFQTWQFDITYKPSFIEREHTNDDTVGSNLVPENLNVGDVVCESSATIDVDATLYIAVTTNWILSELKIESNILAPGGVTVTATGHEGLNNVNVNLGNVIGSDMIMFPLNSSGILALKLFITGINWAAKIENITNMYILPIKADSEHTVTPDSFHLVNNTVTPNVDENVPFYRYDESFSGVSNSVALSIAIDTFGTFVPKNNKVKTYPYNYLFISNNIGNQNLLKIEDFADRSNITFETEFTCSIGGSARLIPKNYKGITRNIDESIPLAKFPTCSWSADSFVNWLTQNSVNNATTMITNTLQGAASSGVMGAATSAASTAANLIGEMYEATLLPRIQGGQSTGDINYAMGDNDFKVYRMHGKVQNLKIIDDYFSMYGYKTNLVKLPNITGRTNWNYVKTINCNITGDIPQMELQRIKEMFNKGVTLWHNPLTFLDYSQTNAIVS